MTTNIGTIDRAARVILGIIIVTLTALGKISPWGWLGVMLIITGTIKFCPAYSLFGFKTCKK
jgi:hypothetical protein